jgi:hypothetical protein
MIAQTTKKKQKHSSRGQRTHVRRMKQEARKGNVPDSQVKKNSRPIKTPMEVVPVVEK